MIQTGLLIGRKMKNIKSKNSKCVEESGRFDRSFSVILY